MKTKDLLNLDFRVKENREIIQRVLGKIKPLSKYTEYEEIPMELLEKCLKVLTFKYAIGIQYINLTCAKSVEEMVFSSSVRNDSTYAWVGNVYGLTLYELISKTIILIYSEIRLERVITREQDAYNKIDRRRKQREDQDE
jgi:hypothetical protein